MKYKECSNKEKLALITAMAAFIIGWGLTIAGFIVPPVGDITSSVLWVLGQALIYAASVFGITGYFNSETTKLKMETKEYIDRLSRNKNFYDEEDTTDNNINDNDGD